TGRLLPGSAPEVADCQGPLDALIAEFFPPQEPARKAGGGQSRRPNPDLIPDDLRIVELVCRRYGALWNGDTSRHGNDESGADLALCNLLAFYCHNDAARIERLFSQSKLGERCKWKDRADYRAMTIEEATVGRTEFYDPNYRSGPNVIFDGKRIDPRPTDGTGKTDQPGPPQGNPDPDAGAGDGTPPGDGNGTGSQTPPPPGRPLILITSQEYEVIKQVFAALRADERLFVRQGRLVSVEFDPPVNGRATPPRIAVLETAEVRTRITRYARLERMDDKGKSKPANPPDWLAKGVCASTIKGDLRYLAAVSTSPVLRVDGTIHQTPGHDPITGVLYVAAADCGTIPETPTRDDARAAADLLLSGVSQFPWRGRIDQAAWLTMVLSVACRHAVDGPAPLFVGVADHPRAGKTALTKAAGIIGTGRETPFGAYPVRRVGAAKKETEDNEEMRKLVTATLAAGHPFYCLDNVPSGMRFGSHVLDSLVTSTVEAGRLTGTGDATARAALTVWSANGNNIVPINDTIHRVIPWRQHVRDPREQKQKGFEGMEVRVWAKQNRATLYAACITLVSAYIRAGRPNQQLPNFAGFEEWSDTIRSAVVWAGLPDPLLTQQDFTATDDDSIEAGHLMDVLFELEPSRGPLTCTEILEILSGDLNASPVAPLKHPAALFAFRSVFPKVVPTSKRFGCVMRSHRGRVVRNRCIGSVEDRTGSNRWTVQLADPQHTPGSGRRENEGEQDRGTCVAPQTQHPAPQPAPQPTTAPTGYDLLRDIGDVDSCAHTRAAKTDPASRTDPLAYTEAPGDSVIHPASTTQNPSGQRVNVQDVENQMRDVGDTSRILRDDPNDPDGTFEITVSV
ncbi:MAG TPA: hypothetical protein VH092_17870, partial [Urbifossiella sp.]|nr:hypothetical protein [Urbifossiella sp.]